jgi:hypothetical protein
MSKGVRGVEKKLAEDGPFARSVEMMEKTLIQNKRPKIVNLVKPLYSLCR